MTRRVWGSWWCGAVALGALLVAAAAESGQGASGRRLALVVGNDQYTEQVPLQNAVNDARAVAEALRDVGFEVRTVENVTRERLVGSLGTFTGSLRSDDVALFYYAGHGVQVEGVNYLLPTDYAGRTVADLRLSALRAADVQELLEPARVAMLVLDACRNNPYRGVRGGNGLAPMEPRGSLIAYAAGAGEFAIDAPPGVANGLFTSKFVDLLKEPGLEASELFRQVRREVYSDSNEQQRPAVYDDLDYPFVFRAATPAPAVADAAAGENLLVLRQQETLFWETIRDSRDPLDFDAFLAEFPDGTFSRLARNRLAGLRGASAAPSPEPAREAPAVAARRDPPAVTPRRDPPVVTPRRDPPAVAARRDPPVVTPRRDPPAVDPPRIAGTVFQDCDECPEMVVQPGGVLALGRYEVTVGEYMAFAAATGAGAGDCSGGSWRDPGFPQTDRHPVTCVSFYDALLYASWLSRMTGAAYRLPTAAEWERAAAGSPPGCYEDRTGRAGTCAVGAYGRNAAGLSDMVGNLYEWTGDCVEGDCRLRMLRGGSWGDYADILRPGASSPYRSSFRVVLVGFRVARTLD